MKISLQIIQSKLFIFLWGTLVLKLLEPENMVLSVRLCCKTLGLKNKDLVLFLFLCGLARHFIWWLLPRSLMQLYRVNWTRKPKRTSHTEISWYHCCGQRCLSLLQWRTLQQDSSYSGLRAVDHKDEKWKLQGLLWPQLWNSHYILLATANNKASQVQGCGEIDCGWKEWKSHIAKWNVYQGRRNYGH